MLVDHSWLVLFHSNDLLYRFKIDKDDDKKVFLIDIGIKLDTIDETILTNHEIPIPVCNANFSLLGKYTESDK